MPGVGEAAGVGSGFTNPSIAAAFGTIVITFGPPEGEVAALAGV